MNNEELKDEIARDLQAINTNLKENGESEHELKVLYDAVNKVYFIDDHNITRSQKTDLVTIATMISSLRELLVDCNEPLRICSVCGNILIMDGYVESEGYDYYCSNECLHTKYTDEEWCKMCDEDDQTYWTEFI